MRKIGAVLALVLLASGFAACGLGRYASASSDTYVCVFDGSERGGQRLKFQLPPGSNSKKIDDNDQQVKIPASDRFYAVSLSDTVRDPGAPKTYPGYASGGTPVWVEGQIPFKFNLTKACDWYSKYGRRNLNDHKDLGFNVRGDANQGWFLFLNQYFGQIMTSVVDETIGKYDWARMHYNYASNADDAGIVPDGQEPALPTRQVLAQDLALKFTQRLNETLGADYFCGVKSQGAECKPMEFQVTYAGPGPDSTLVKSRQKFEDTKQTLKAASLEGELQATQQAQLLEAEKAKAALLQEQAKTALAQAQIDNAKCIILADRGLDCEGHRPQNIIAGG